MPTSCCTIDVAKTNLWSWGNKRCTEMNELMFLFASVLEVACHDSQYGVQECALISLRSMCTQQPVKQVRFVANWWRINLFWPQNLGILAHAR